MAYNQSHLCMLERKGVRHVRKLVGACKRQAYKAPFDLVAGGIGYEVKAISADCRDAKIHIADSSFKRKLDYALENNLQPVLIAVVLGKTGTTIYQSDLKQSIRIAQMTRIGG